VGTTEKEEAKLNNMMSHHRPRLGLYIMRSCANVLRNVQSGLYVNLYFCECLFIMRSCANVLRNVQSGLYVNLYFCECLLFMCKRESVCVCVSVVYA
jgi:hypothetical protein